MEEKPHGMSLDTVPFSIIASGVSAAHGRLGFGGVLARGSFGDGGRDVWL